MKKIIWFILLGLLLLVGCGKATFTALYKSCSVVGQQIVCPDGTEYSLPTQPINGIDGADGIDGIDGINGTVVTVYDPCGDYTHSNDPNSAQSYDEVLMILDTGEVIAWFQNVGFVVLQPGVAYVTTDQQRCAFSVTTEGVINEL